MQSNIVRATDAFSGRGRISAAHRLETPWPIETYSAQLIKTVRPSDETKLMAIAPGFSSPQYGEAAALVFVFLPLYFLKIIHRWNMSADFALDGSNDADRQRKELFRCHENRNYIQRSIFLLKIPIGLAVSQQMYERFPGYLYAVSMDKPRNTIVTGNAS
jgi:hypothetical protein